MRKRYSMSSADIQQRADYVLRRFGLIFNHLEISRILTVPYLVLKEDEITGILMLPRQTAIEDFERIIKFSFANVFNPIEDGLNRNAVDLSLIFLYYLKSIESTSLLIDYLRQDVGYMYIWQNNGAIESFTWPVFAYCAMYYPKRFVSFALEPDLYLWNRAVAPQSLAKVAIIHPELYENTIEIFKDLLMKYYIKHNDRRVFDPEFVGILEKDVIEMGATELLTDLQIFHDEKLVDESYWGNFAKVSRRTFKGKLSPDDVKPKSIFETLKSFGRHCYTKGDEEGDFLWIMDEAHNGPVEESGFAMTGL